MARVGFDISALDPTFKAHAARGIGRYVRELFTHFQALSSTELEILQFDYKDFTLPQWAEETIQRLPAGRQTVRQQIVYPFQLSSKRFKKFDVLHFPAQMDAPSWTRRPYVLTVLDLIPLVCQDLYKAENPSWRFHLARWLELRGIKGASLLFAISKCTAQDIERLLGVPQRNIVVTPLGIDEKFYLPPQELVLDRVKREYRAESTPLFLYVGGIDPRKNVSALLTIMNEVRAVRLQQGKALPRLVMAGKTQQDKSYPALIAEISRLGLNEQILLPGFVSDEELLALYSLSTAFLFPSLYEGFGLPPLEAMAGGLPVISSNSSSLPEVLGDAALYFDPTKPEQAVSSLLELCENVELQGYLREKGKVQARKFQWSTTARLTVEGYREFFSRQGYAS